MARKKDINFFAIEGMELYGLDLGRVFVTCVPVGPEHIRAPRFGFMCSPAVLKDVALGLVKVADAAEAHFKKGKG